MLNYNLNVIGSQRDRTIRKAPPLPFGEFFIQLQVVGGGGAGSADIGGAGGAGGVHYVPAYLINDEKTYTVNVANSSSGYFAYRATAGGSFWNADPPNSNRSGSNSWFRDDVTLQDITAYGGGMGGAGNINTNGNNGGSGGGGSQFSGNGGSPIGPNTGSSGGSSGPSNYQGGGGGGGAASAGITGNSQFTANASDGGAGIAILGFESGSTFVAGGGGGALNGGVGGIGGGGNHGNWDGDISSSVRPQNGTPNTGGGGGGLYGVVPNQYTSSFDTGGGGSGIVVILYKGIQQAYGGQVETRELSDGLYTQHIYTASGQFIPVSHT